MENGGSNRPNLDEAIARSLVDEPDPAMSEGTSTASGRPRGRPRKRDLSPEARAKMAAAGRKSAPGRKAEPPPPPPLPPPTEEEIRAYAMLGTTVWTIAGKIIGMRQLTPEESLQLGGAMAPVGQKWAPFMSKWMPELTLVVVVVSLYNATKIHVAPEPEPEMSEAA